jgi:hypothetical protein
VARRDDERDPEGRPVDIDTGRTIDADIEPSGPVDIERARGEPPVVARLVVEIRSDGSRTIARGAMEDAATGRGVAIEASGRSPLQLALSLARSLVTLPAFGRSARALLRGRSPGGGHSRPPTDDGGPRSSGEGRPRPAGGGSGSKR